MRKLSIIIAVMVSILVMTMLTGCNPSEYQKSIYGQNSFIAKQGDSYTYKNNIGKTTKDELDRTFERFYGMETIWTIDANEEDTLNVEFDSKVENGEFKIVFIDAENKVSKIFEGSNKGTAEIRIQKGKSRIKVVGKDAKGEIKLRIKPVGNLAINKNN